MRYKPQGFVLACLFLFQGLFLWAAPELGPGTPEAAGVDIQRVAHNPLANLPPPRWTVADHDDSIPPARRRFAFGSRTFELSLFQTGFHASNTFIAAADVFQNPFRILGNLISADSFDAFRDDPGLYYKDLVSINIDNFFNGFRLNFGLDVAPFSMNLNIRDRWGFGFDIAHITTTGNLLLPQNVLGLQEVENEQLGAGAAIFADVAVPVFFHTRGGTRVRIRPAAYVPLVFARPGVSYSFGNSNAGGLLGQRIELTYNMQVFSIFSLEDFFDNGSFDIGDPAEAARAIASGNMGYDISLGIEHPMSRRFSIGVDISNIPFIAATLNEYVRIRGTAFVDTSFVDIEYWLNNDDVPLFPSDASGFSVEDLKFGTLDGGYRIRRPFTVLLYGNFRPFETQTLAFIPSFGFSINNLYVRRASLEGGLSARLDLANIFITTIGVNYNDRRWRNSLDFAFNFRLFEIGIGVSSQSPAFGQSFRGAGLGVNFGFKMGW
ncbi:MAG: hypothetical protein FWD88_01550 [Treponema sp.]|nr:hypothetical protein [Treponema sp.]